MGVAKNVSWFMRILRVLPPGGRPPRASSSLLLLVLAVLLRARHQLVVQAHVASSLQHTQWSELSTEVGRETRHEDVTAEPSAASGPTTDWVTRKPVVHQMLGRGKRKIRG